MKATLTIDMDNAAFEDNGPATELGRILRELAGKVEQARVDDGYDGEDIYHARDANGHRVGELRINDEGQANSPTRVAFAAYLGKQGSHYDLARELEDAGFVIVEDDQDDEHSFVLLPDNTRVGEIVGDAEAEIG